MKHSLPSIQIDVTNKCTLSCGECNRHIPYFKDHGNWFLSANELISDLQKLTTVLDFPVINFEGGEPLLHPNIIDLVRAAREHNFSKKIGITTNGELANKFTDELIGEIDIVQLSLYPNCSQKHLDLISKLREFGKEVIITPISDFYNSFRKTREEPRPCWLYRKCYNYAYGHVFRCPAVYSINLITHGKIIDGVDLKDDNFKSQIDMMMLEDSVYDACHYCDIPKVNKTKWFETNKDDWITRKLG